MQNMNLVKPHTVFLNFFKLLWPHEFHIYLMCYNQLHSLFFSMSKWSQTWLEGDPLRWIPYPFYKNTLVFKFLPAV